MRLGERVGFRLSIIEGSQEEVRWPTNQVRIIVGCCVCDMMRIFDIHHSIGCK